MALNIGELFGSLSWRHDKGGADEFDRRYDDAQAKARKKIEAQLGAAVDERAFAKYHESLDRAERRAKQKEAFKVALGADFDPKGFAAFSRAANQAERDAHKAKASTKSFSDEIDGLSVKLPSLSRTMGLLKWPAIIAGAGMAAQAVSAATAGVTALGSALAPLSGALAAYPALGSAAAQGIGVLKLGTDGLADGFTAAAEGGKAWEDELKKLTPQQAAFIRELKPVVDNVKSLKADARENMLPGLERGALAASKNVGVLRPIVEATAKEIGHLADEAGRMLGSKAWGRDFETQGQRNVKWIGQAGEGGLHLANALRNVTLAAGPLVGWMVRGVVNGTKLVDTFTAQARQSGKLADFFHQTQVEMSRVVRIGADVATAFFNISKAGKPLGDDILVSIVKAADHFRRWTDSARGQNAIAEYFRQARPAIFELGRLLHDVTIDFLKLGQGNQVAPLIRTIRVDLLPRFVELVDQTTKAFGPPMLEAIKQVAILFTTMGGTNGPLVQLVTLVGKIAGAINKATDAVPGLGSAISSLSTVASLYAALRIASTLSGLSRIIRLIKDARKASVATGAVEVATGAGGAAAGAAGAAGAGAGATGAAARGGIAGAIVSKLPIAAIGAAIAAAIAAAIPKTKAHRKFTDFFNFDSTKLDDQLSAVDRFNKALGRLSATGDKKGADRLADQFTHLKNAAHGLGSVRDIDRLTASANDLAKAGGTLNREIGKALGQAAKHFADFRRTGSNNLEGIRHATSDNMHFIRRKLGEDSAAGKEALARNFRLARTAIRQAMQDGRVSVKDGLAEIQRLMRAELKQYGITGGVASSIIKHGNIKGSDAPAAGHARGGWVAKARHAVGGWIGRRDMVSGDVVPIGDGALAAFGEYDAHGPGGQRAILNRHQAPIVEAALAAGGYPGLDQLPGGRQLPILERALAPLGGLDRLFAAITRPHFLANGGRLRRFQGGGLHLPEGISPTHQTANLPGYPAQDIFASPGTPVFAPVAGIIARLSGQAGGPGGGGAYGYSIYENGSNGRSYFLTHFGSTRVRPGQHVDRSTVIGTVADYPGGVPDHIHEGVHGGLTGITAGGPSGAGAAAAPAWKDIQAPQTGSRGALGAIVQAALDRVTAGANQRGAALAASSDPGGTGVVGPVARGSFSFDRLRALWIQAGGAPSRAALMAHIAQAESGGNPNAHNPSGATGLWQILGAILPGNLTDPLVNARNAVAKLRSQGLGAWAASRSVWGQYASRGGRMQRFAGGGQRFQSGGRAGSKKLKLPHGIGKATAGLVRHVAPLQTDRSSTFDALMNRVESADGEYQRWERRFNITDEELIDSDTGAINVAAIHRKAKELTQLVMIRAGMERDLKEAREVARRLVASYRRVIRALRKSLRHAKNKDRSGIRSYISTYEKRASEWTGKVGEVGGTLFDTHTDLLQVRKELREVLATKPESRDATADIGGGDGIDLSSDGGADTGADTAAAAEPAPAPPTALDIAAGVQAALAEYKSQQSDLIRNFGANAVGARAAFQPGGVLSGTPDLEGAALGALRGFGGGSNLAGSLGAGSGGPSIGTLQVNFATPPADGPTLVQQLRFQVENGGVG